VLAIWNFSNGYRVLGLLHILAAVAAFGPLFIYPSMQRAGAGAEVARLHMRLSLPALVLTWVFGMGLVGLSKPDGSDETVFEMSQTWIVLSLLCWVAAVAVSWFLIRPSLGDESESARSKLAAGIGVTHLIAVVVLYLMIFKPGGPDGF
jgi:uncharacterized membrane protein